MTNFLPEPGELAPSFVAMEDAIRSCPWRNLRGVTDVLDLCLPFRQQMQEGFPSRAPTRAAHASGVQRVGVTIATEAPTAVAEVGATLRIATVTNVDGSFAFLEKPIAQPWAPHTAAFHKGAKQHVTRVGWWRQHILVVQLTCLLVHAPSFHAELAESTVAGGAIHSSLVGICWSERTV